MLRLGLGSCQIAYALFEAEFLRKVYFVHASGMEAAHMHKRNKGHPAARSFLSSQISITRNPRYSTASVLPIQGETTSSQWSSSSPWYCSEPRLALNRAVVLRFRLYLETLGLAAGTVNQCLAAVRRLAYEAADSGLLSPELAAGIRRVKSVMQLGARSGNWLIQDQSRLLLEKARRDFDAAPSAVRNPANSPKSADWSGLLFHTRCRTQGLPNCVGIG